jgi:hypothetical protein
MKTYVITLSKYFMKGHPKEGQETHFKEKFLAGEKIHTIRGNLPLWQKRFEQIDKGEACLSIRQWEGKPYASKQVELKRLTAEDGIGLQEYTYHGAFDPVNIPALADNDGLDIMSWLLWFKTCALGDKLAIIHFTTLRYPFI